MANGEQQSVVQCETCGTITPIPDDAPEETTVAANDVTQLVASLPAMSQKNAHSKLEELLYEHRSAIESSDAFADALAALDATEYEMQDIKVQEYHRDEADLVATFTYYAVGERDDDQAPRGLRVDGTGSARISAHGSVEIQDVTATVSDI
ncbi:MAG TPA: hypothetical protein VL475_03975 [Planctomycetaceae bacterium]|nr:hypothetical protein [Planctomycetaceae bacterium]